MHIEQLEALAFGEDRDGAVNKLVPGSVEHAYWSAIQLQHAMKLDEVDRCIAAWTHGDRAGSALRERLERRQLLLRAGVDFDSTAEKLRQKTNTSLDHQREREVAANSYPSSLDDSAFSVEAEIDRRITSRRMDLDAFTAWANDTLVAKQKLLSPAQRKALVARIGTTGRAEIVDAVARELIEIPASSFGGAAVHDTLTLDQLLQLRGNPKVESSPKFVPMVLARMAPPAHADRTDPSVLGPWIDAALEFARTLAPGSNAVRAQALLAKLDFERCQGRVDRALLIELLTLPLSAAFTNRERAQGFASSTLVHGHMLASPAEMPALRADAAEIVASICERLLREDDCEDLAPLLDARWFALVRARAQLCAGRAGAERWTEEFGAEWVASLRDEIRLRITERNALRFGSNARVSIEVELKNIESLTVKVFALDPVAYFHSKRSSIDATINLDGMIAQHERTLRFDHAPIIAHIESIALPECDGPGTYAVELIGNGRSARAFFVKGQLQVLCRPTVAGTLVVAFDEAGEVLRDAHVFMGGREFTAREDGGVTLPFSNEGRALALIVGAGYAQVHTVELAAERFDLSLVARIERESLVAQKRAILLLKPTLSGAGYLAPLSLIEEPTVEINATKHDGVSTSKSDRVTLSDDRETTVELRVTEDLASLSVTLRGYIRYVTTGQRIAVSATVSVETNGVHATNECDELYLSRSTAGYTLECLGKSGEPIADRVLTVYLHYRALSESRTVTLQCDSEGRARLGALDGIEWLSVTTATGKSRQWRFWANSRLPLAIHRVEGERIELPWSNPSSLANAGLSLFSRSLSHHRANRTDACRVEGSTLVIEGLAPGEYALRVDPFSPAISVVIARRPQRITASCAVDRGVIVELTAPQPFVRDVTVDGDSLLVRVAHAKGSTRVHLIATRFTATDAAHSGALAAQPRRTARAPLWITNALLSNRELGDEHRYVIERRAARPRAGVMLDKPGLLSNPWARSSVETRRETLAAESGWQGGAAGGPSRNAPAPKPSAQARSSTIEDGGPRRTYDFLADPATIIANLPVGADETVRVPLARLGDARLVTVIAASYESAHEFEFALEDRGLRRRDLRLSNALASDAHAIELRSVEPAPAQSTLTVEDVRTSKLELLDTVAGVWRTLSTLDAACAPPEWAWITSWSSLDEARKRALYSEHSCHELHLFLSQKDRDFFDRVVRPHLQNKRHKTFVDRALLGEDLSRYLDPWALSKLNAIERALLARAHAPARAALIRWMSDAVELTPPDPERERKLLDTILGASGLSGGAFTEAVDQLAAVADLPTFHRKRGASQASPAESDDAQNSMDESDAPEEAKEEEPSEPDGYGEGGGGARGDKFDMNDRALNRQAFRSPEKTQEWAESNWWRTRQEHATAERVGPNRFWLDWARHTTGPFLSPHFAECATSFSDALCALAVMDVPFEAARHQSAVDDVRYTVTVQSHALAASTRIARCETSAARAGDPVLIGQRYLRDDDRDEYEGNVHREKYVTGPMLVGVAYVCRVVVSNPSSAQRELDLLLQIPKGAMPISRGFVTRSSRLWLDAYATQSIEYAFYFPGEGRWSHFGAHVSEGEQLVAFAEGSTLEVVRALPAADKTSWEHLSQHASLAELVDHLRACNLGRVDLARIAWRLRDRSAFDTVISLLESRLHFEPTLWSYALLHRDAARARAWLAHQQHFIAAAGPALDHAIIELDPIERSAYEHLEYAPLINARAHRVGARVSVLNDGLSAQYQRFLDVLAHRSTPSSDELLSAVHYLFAQERVDEAVALLARVDTQAVTARVAFDYLRAYARCAAGELAAARALATPWLEYPVDHWRKRFAELVACLDEAESTAAPSTAERADGREQRNVASASVEPAIDVAIESGRIAIQHRNVRACELRLYRMDIELLFSREPFVQGDIERFSWISPGHSQSIALDGDGRTAVDIPAQLARDNLVIEVRARSARKAIAWYAHDLGVEVTAAFGQLRVLRASTQRPLAATYVKVFARHRGGAVRFFKDGYTDVRGRFDFASVSTNDLDTVERFAILVCSEQSGSTVLEAAPPTR